MLAPLTTQSARALLSPSARVLVAAAESDCGVARANELPWSDVHWPTLISLTSFERAESQVFRLLRAAPDGAVPEDVMAAMQRVFRVAVFRSGELGDAAGVACDALKAAGVSALWLKGAALAMQSPDEFALRSMGDLDILVAPAEHAAAREALAAAGWRGASDATYNAHHHDAPMLWRGGIRLELHSGLFPPGHPFADDTAGDWIARGAARQWGARSVTVLPEHWHVVHTSVHWAWNHEGAIGTWQYLHDLHWLTRGWAPSGPEWQQLSSAAKEIAASAPVGWGLWTGARLGSASVDVLARLRGQPRVLSGVAEREWVLRAFYSPMASPSVTWSRFWWRRAMGGLGDARQDWPWTRGRAALPAESDEAAEAGRGAERRSDSMARWRRHLGRVLRS
jgi:hypothetical protein